MSRNFNLSALLTDIKDSLAGTERDFTTGSIGRAVTILAIPMVLELSMQAVFGVIDVFFVAKLGGEAVDALDEPLARLVRRVGLAGVDHLQGAGIH